MLLANKRGVILGVANHRSIAWAIAKRFHEQGAKLALTYQGDRLKKNAEELAAGMPGTILADCDVSKDESVDALASTLRAELETLDFVVHSVAFANREDLKQPFHQTSRAGYALAQDISSYSLISVVQRLLPLMEGRPASIMAMTYQGSTRVVPGYNVMGVAKAALEAAVRYLASDLGPRGMRVNSISAGPVKTLASAGIAGFNTMMGHHRERAPMQRDVEIEEVADAALFLASDLSRGMTGEILHVDGGYHIMG